MNLEIRIDEIGFRMKENEYPKVCLHMKYRMTSGMNSADFDKNDGASERKGGAAGELAKWNLGSETDTMVVVASPAKVRCGGGAQNSVRGIVALVNRRCFGEKEGSIA